MSSKKNFEQWREDLLLREFIHVLATNPEAEAIRFLELLRERMPNDSSLGEISEYLLWRCGRRESEPVVSNSTLECFSPFGLNLDCTAQSAVTILREEIIRHDLVEELDAALSVDH